MEKNYRKILEDFFKQYTKLSYKPGSIIVSSSDETSGVYYVQKGCVTASIILDNIKPPVRTHLYTHGVFFDLSWVFDVDTYRYEYEAISSVTLYRAPKTAFQQLLVDHPDFMTRMVKKILEIAHQKDLRNAIMIQETASVKVAYMLIFLAQYFGDTTSNQPITIPLSQKELASWMGVTRETVSAQMQYLESKKIISKSREHITITNFSALEGLVPVENNP